MKLKLALASMILMFVLAACGAPAPASAPGDRGFLQMEGPAAPAMPMPAATMSPNFGIGGGAPSKDLYAAPAEAPQYEAASQVVSSDRMVVKNADLSIVVKDVPGRLKAIQDMAKAMGGFVVSANMYETSTRTGETVPQASITIRVPQERLEDALTQIKSGVEDVQNENQSGTDVTDQYVDLQSRLKAKLAAEEQLLTIMKDAHRTEDVLAVYAQLQQVQSEIEVLRGQIKYTEQSAALSAISVNIIAEESTKEIELGPWKPQGAIRDAIQNLIYFWQDFVDFMIKFFLYTLPVLLTIAIPLFLVYLLVRWLVRKFRKPASDAAPIVSAKKK